MSEEVEATKVVDAEIFGDLWAYLMENYSDSPEKMIQATLALDVASALLHKELDLPVFEVKVEDE